MNVLPAGTRVAVLSHAHPSISKGGAEIAAHTLFRGLRAIGVDAVFVAMCEEAALPRIALGDDEFVCLHDSLRYDHFYHLAPIGVRQSLLDLLRRERVQLLSAHHFLHVGIGALADVARAGIPVALTLHEFLSICHNHGQLITRPDGQLCDGPSPAKCRTCYPEHRRQQFAVRFDRFAAAWQEIGAFVAPSQFLADRVVAAGVPAARMHMVENGLIPRAQNGEAAHGKQARRVWRFGYFGQINPFKGVDLLLDACAIIARDPERAATLRIAIHGNFIGQSEAFIDRVKQAVEEYPFLSYFGPYDNAVVGRLMARCDYVVVPSKWWENSPVVIQEAYRAGCPVVGTGIGGLAEKIVHGVTGLHFDWNDPADLADRIVEAADAEVHAQLSAALPVTLTPEDMAHAYCEIFAPLLAHSSV